MRVVADRAQAIERWNAEGRGEVTVRAAPDSGTSDLGQPELTRAATRQLRETARRGIFQGAAG